MIGNLNYLSLRGLDDFSFSIVLAAVFGAPAAFFGGKGLLAMGGFFTLLGVAFRTSELLEIEYGSGLDEPADIVKESVEMYAKRLGIETPKVRVQRRKGMKADHGKERYGHIVPNPLGQDIVVLNEIVEKWLKSDAINPEEKQDMLAVVAHVSQRPRTSLVQSVTLGFPYFLAAGASVVLNSIWLVVGVVILLAVVRKAWITVLFRRSEFDAEKKSVELAGPEAVRDYYDDIDPIWHPFSSSPSQWRRVEYLEENGYLQ